MDGRISGISAKNGPGGAYKAAPAMVSKANDSQKWLEPSKYEQKNASAPSARIGQKRTVMVGIF